MAITHCKIWNRLSISYKTFEMKLKNGNTLTGEYISNMMIYVSICINFSFFLTDGELNDIHVSPHQSAGQSPQISAKNYGRKVKRLYMDCTVLETAEKRKTAVLYASTAYNLSVTLKLNTTYK